MSNYDLEKKFEVRVSSIIKNGASLISATIAEYCYANSRGKGVQNCRDLRRNDDSKISINKLDVYVSLLLNTIYDFLQPSTSPLDQLRVRSNVAKICGQKA